MKNVSLFFVLGLCGILSCTTEKKQEQQVGSTEIRIKGSESELPLALKLVDYYKKHSETPLKFSVSGGGSNIGISLLESDQIDLAMSSRKLKEEEKRYLLEKSVEVEEMIVAYDALFIIVNKKNPIGKITTEQLKKIYTGKISNWSELGAFSAPVVKCSRRATSGTKDFFESIVLSGDKADASVREFDNYSSMLELVKKDPGAIGFNSLGYNTDEVKYLSISLDKGKSYFSVNETSKLTKDSYPLVRPLYLIYQKRSEEKIKPFIDFVKSDSAKSLIRGAGFIL